MLVFYESVMLWTYLLLFRGVVSLVSNTIVNDTTFTSLLAHNASQTLARQATNASLLPIQAGPARYDCDATRYGTPNRYSCLHAWSQMGGSGSSIPYVHRETGGLPLTGVPLPYRYTSCAFSPYFHLELIKNTNGFI